MRALLLASVGVIALGGTAFASGGGHGGGHGHGNPSPHVPTTVEDYYAAALAVNLGSTENNSSATGHFQSNRVSMSGSFGNLRGVANANQNAGANSQQQNAVAVAYVEGCDCVIAPPGSPHQGSTGEANANAVAVNAGGVIGNTSSNMGSSASASMDGSFNSSTGIAQANQNAGANSLQQNATAVAMVDNVRGRQQDRDAWAIAGNAGIVTGSGNLSADHGHQSAASMSNSFNGFTGSANVNQNVGANSLQQNATALSAITYCNCAAEDLSTTIAAAGNVGAVWGNAATASWGSAQAGMSNSFNGLTGVAQVSQNAGANSLMQNAVAVGAIYNR
ncbi:hypothetical protein GCM10010964_32400 [Caldovatus sediminis]|uniref:Heme utilization protein n=1 Tax=Caldovatus sediminis TaxID=2041189 RepID=A0A8J2ZDE5_9PROT|nr:hypothetical protein [Caldovatus sediminis]GGG42421.1 hypothetical protein GCM10010964_32400 [Caldovatus sediminis]